MGAAFIQPPNFVHLPRATRAPAVSVRPTMSVVAPLLKAALTTAAFQTTFYCLSRRFRTDKLTDIAGTSNILLLPLITLPNPLTPRPRLLVSVTAIWAFRLSFFLFRRIHIWKRDRRLDTFRNSSTSLAFFWACQSIWVFVVSLPSILSNCSPSTPLTKLDAVPATISLLGVLIEAVADFQKLRHAASPAAKWPCEGLWRLSRHPNYFGEMLVWIGIYFLARPSLHALSHIAVVSPIFIVLLLLFGSGVPILERSANVKYAASDDYKRYKMCTSVLIPFPPRLYATLPPRVKTTLFLDLPMYNAGINHVASSAHVTDKH